MLKQHKAQDQAGIYNAIYSYSSASITREQIQVIKAIVKVIITPKGLPDFDLYKALISQISVVSKQYINIFCLVIVNYKVQHNLFGTHHACNFHNTKQEVSPQQLQCYSFQDSSVCFLTLRSRKRNLAVNTTTQLKMKEIYYQNPPERLDVKVHYTVCSLIIKLHDLVSCY